MRTKKSWEWAIAMTIFLMALFLAGCAHEQPAAEDNSARMDIIVLRDRVDRLEHQWSEMNREPVLQRVEERLREAHSELTEADIQLQEEKEKLATLKEQEKRERRRHR